MPRINPTVSDEAYKIYNDLPLKDKKPWVSDAIIEKFKREQGNALESRIDVLEKQVKELKELIERKG